MDYRPQERNAGPKEFEIAVVDPTLDPVPEVEKILDTVALLNAQKSKVAGKNIYRLEEELRDDPVVGKYTVMVISEFRNDGQSRPIQKITFVDKETGLPLANTLNKDLKKVNNTLRSKGLEAFAKMRGVKLEVARTSKMKVRFTAEPDNAAKQAAALKRRLAGDKDA